MFIELAKAYTRHLTTLCNGRNS